MFVSRWFAMGALCLGTAMIPGERAAVWAGQCRDRRASTRDNGPAAAAAKIRTDLLPHAVAGIPWVRDPKHRIVWAFADSSNLRVTPGNWRRDARGDIEMVVSVNAVTAGRGGTGWKRLRGRLLLRYVNSAGAWRLSSVANIDSTYDVFDGANRELHTLLRETDERLVSAREQDPVPIRLAGPAILQADLSVNGGQRDIYAYIVDQRGRLVSERHRVTGAGPWRIEAPLRAGSYWLVLDNRHAWMIDKKVQVTLFAKYR
ncbi:MAG: hypothetical protein SF339_23640 [Blastocatellia bacterium]|nr:hypothetical protein [Blastocatellia bacterium]